MAEVKVGDEMNQDELKAWAAENNFIIQSLNRYTGFENINSGEVEILIYPNEGTFLLVGKIGERFRIIMAEGGERHVCESLEGMDDILLLSRLPFVVVRDKLKNEDKND